MSTTQQTNFVYLFFILFIRKYWEMGWLGWRPMREGVRMRKRRMWKISLLHWGWALSVLQNSTGQLHCLATAFLTKNKKQQQWKKKKNTYEMFIFFSFFNEVFGLYLQHCFHQMHRRHCPSFQQPEISLYNEYGNDHIIYYQHCHTISFPVSCFLMLKASNVTLNIILCSQLFSCNGNNTVSFTSDCKNE